MFFSSSSTHSDIYSFYKCVIALSTDSMIDRNQFAISAIEKLTTNFNGKRAVTNNRIVAGNFFCKQK
jgi:hypothetical protein